MWTKSKSFAGNVHSCVQSSISLHGFVTCEPNERFVTHGFLTEETDNSQFHIWGHPSRLDGGDICSDYFAIWKLVCKVPAQDLVQSFTSSYEIPGTHITQIPVDERRYC